MRKRIESLSLFYLPAILLAAGVFVWAFGRGEYQDDFVGRVEATIGFLNGLDILSLLGLNAAMAERSADYGIAYFLLSQSLMGVVAIWLLICLLAPDRAYPRAYLSTPSYLHSTKSPCELLFLLDQDCLADSGSSTGIKFLSASLFLRKTLAYVTVFQRSGTHLPSYSAACNRP